jgi:hypothetical protein
MPSPKSKQRSSSTSLAHLGTGAAVRRGDITISDPIPIDQGQDGHPPSTTAGMNAMTTTSWQQDGTWPRKSTTPPEMAHVRNASYGQERTNVGRASAGPSLIPSSVSTTASKSSLAMPRKSSGGFRTALKRMFGSKRGRSVETRKEYHRSVSDLPIKWFLLLSLYSLANVDLGSRKFDVHHGETNRGGGGTNSNPG